MPHANSGTLMLQRRALAQVTLAGSILSGWANPSLAECAQIEKLRALAKNEFVSVRGAKDEIDPLQYASQYRMTNAHKCHIDTTDKKDFTNFKCMWRLSRGISSEGDAKNFFDQTVKSFEGCLSKADRRKRYSRKGEVAEFEVKPVAGSSKPRHSLEISYSFYAPWWEMEIDYQVAEE